MAEVLIVDDEECIRHTFRRYLEQERHTATAVPDFAEAIGSISERQFDLVICDIVLGGNTGIDLLREVRARGLDCPVVMMTGYPDHRTAAEAVRLGAFDYLAKPVEQEALLRVARLALEHKRLLDTTNRHRAHLESVMRSVGEGILTVDRELNLVELNGAAERLCGISRDRIGETLDDPEIAFPEKLLDAVRVTLASGTPLTRERIECPSGAQAPRILTITVSPLIDARGLPTGAVMVARDETRLAALERRLEERRHLHRLIGASDPMQRIYALIESLADVETTVLITGESGTGKELAAEALHDMGARSRGPLVKVNCSALSENLLESELFGHAKGAFTGAVSDRIGRFQRADGGTIFLDEIGDISPRVQSSLLRVLQQKEFERVGESKPLRVDLRVIAATNKNLLEKVRAGEFREDLYFRLNVVELAIPPLRDRPEDIPLLVRHFLDLFNDKFHKAIRGVSAEVEELFMAYSWPGNVRELEHAMEHAFVLCRLDTISLDALPHSLAALHDAERMAWKGTDGLTGEAIRKALERTEGNKTQAAKLLGVDRKTLYRNLEKHGIADRSLLSIAGAAP